MERKENVWNEGFYFVLSVYNKAVRSHTGSMWNPENGESVFLRNVFTYRWENKVLELSRQYPENREKLYYGTRAYV